MRKSTLFLALFIAFSTFSQSTYSPTLYVKSFQQELLKFKSLNERYYFDVSTDAHRTKIATRYKSVVEQLKLGRATIGMMKPYDTDSTLIKVYTKAFDNLLSIYTTKFEEVENLRKYRNTSYTYLKAYDQAFLEGIQRVINTENMLQKNEKDFAEKMNVRLKQDYLGNKKIQISYRTHSHIMAINETYFSINQKVEHLTTLLNEGNNTDMYVFIIEQKLDSLKTDLKNVHNEMKKIKESGNYVNSKLVKEGLNYLENTSKDVEKVLTDIVVVILDPASDKQALNNAKIDLRFFTLDYEIVRNRFTKTRNSWVANTFDSIYTTFDPKDLELVASNN